MNAALVFADRRLVFPSVFCAAPLLNSEWGVMTKRKRRRERKVIYHKQKKKEFQFCTFSSHSSETFSWEKGHLKRESSLPR